MFTDRWAVQGEVVTKRKDAFNSSSTVWSDPKGNAKKGGRGFGLPSPAKFRSGHLTSGAIPVSRVIPASGDCDGSGLDMDTSSDSQDEVYSGQQSLDSSAQEDKTPNMAPICTAPMPGKVKYGMKEDHSNWSSSRGPAQQKQANSVGRYQSHFVDELSDSATSIDVSSIHCRSSNDVTTAPYIGEYTSDCSSTVTSRAKDFHCRGPKEKELLKHMPSAPPIGSDAKFGKMVAEISAAGVNEGAYSANLKCFVTTDEAKTSKPLHSSNRALNGNDCGIPDRSERIAGGKQVNAPTNLLARVPTFHASTQGPWCAVISYDACVRLCLHSWSKGCAEEASYFLNNECALLRNAFGLQQVLLQAEEELLAKRSSEFVSEVAAPKPRKTSSKIKVQVRRVQMGLDPPAGCNLSTLNPSIMKLGPVRQHFSNLNSALYSGWEAVRKVRLTPHIPPNGSFSQQGLAYMRASTQYVKQVSKLLRSGVTTLRNSPSPSEVVQEAHMCVLRMKSSSEEDSVQMQPGSGENHVFFPDNHADGLIVEVHDSKGHYCGHALAQVAAIADDPSDKIRWWPIYHQPDHELVGRLQLCITYSTMLDESNHPRVGCVAETVAYDFVLEVAMKVQHFQPRNLLLHGPWKWLVTKFASYYGVSDAYTKLRYLSYIMDIATPTKDCLDLVYDLLLPVVMKGNRKSVLSHQENRILGEVEEQIQQILALAFENYKSLDESSLSGMVDAFGPATGVVAPALVPAVKLYNLLHDILSPEAKLKFIRYFQAAARARSRRHLVEMDEFISSNEGMLMDLVSLKNLYQKMKSVILNIRNEICTDIQIHNQHVLPSFIDLHNLSAAIYNADLCSRLRTFLVACPPSSPSSPVVELVIATADFQMDLASWNIIPVKGGVDAKELFHLYITLWIRDKRRMLLELCKQDKVKWSGVRTQDSTTPFIHAMYEQLDETLKEYDTIISRWPEYAIVLENAIADVEKAIIEALDKQFVDVLYPLKDNLMPKILGFKYVQKLAKRTGEIYSVPDELGILLNSLKRMLDVLRPRIEIQIKSWTSCVNGVNTVAGESLSEIAVILRSKFRSYIQAVVEKLVENTQMQNTTKLKRIIQDSKETVVESDVQSRMQLLKDLLISTMDHLHSIVEPLVFIAICRVLWDRMGQDTLRFLQNRRENRSWYKCSRIAVSRVDEIFASQMQRLLGNALQEKDLEPPRAILEVRSLFCN